MSQIILKRKDASGMLKSYKEVYDLSPLSSIEEEYQGIILRIVKKSILGCNYCNSYIRGIKKSYDSAGMSLISLPLILQNIFNCLAEFYNEEDEIKLKSGNGWVKYATLVWSIITIIVQTVLIIKECKREENMDKHMQTLTQSVINEENEKLKNKYFCEISKDGNFDIIINKINNNDNSKIKYKNCFSKYVINIPNVNEAQLLSDCIYFEIFSKMDEEIVLLLLVYFIVIENSNKEKLQKFFRISGIISLSIPVYNFYYPENTLKKFNLYFVITNALIIIYNIFNFYLNIKNQKRSIINLINQLFISKGYFINITDEIISIFALKDEYIFNKNIKRIGDINEFNQRKCNLLLA